MTIATSSEASRLAGAATELRPIRFDGDRRHALVLDGSALHDARALAAGRQAIAQTEPSTAIACVFVTPAAADRIFAELGFSPLGDVPELVRPLRLGAAPLVLPFGRTRRAGVREIALREPRVTRLWDRFSIDVGAALERTARWMDPKVFESPARSERGERTFVFEDGDRYVIRAMCIFRTDPPRGRGEVVELLHDRSVAGMRAASHLLGLALREMSDAGAREAIAWSLPHSGTFPLFLRHLFLPRPSRALRFGVRALDPAIADLALRREHWYLSLLDRDLRPS